MGSGKTTLLNSVLNTANPDEFIVVNLSATSGEFLGPPTFDNLLEAICRRLVVPQPAKQRPATLAALATTVSTFDNGRILLLAIDHADHLTDEVTAEVTRLAEYLDISPASLVCVFVGSSSLASRIDSVLRCQGADPRLAEIRLSQPSTEELAALLAYKDTAQPDGPMLTPEAIGRISTYAKSNLHRAVPMADAARSLAESDGKREITPEMVRAALLEIWSPEQPQPSNSLRPNEQDALRTSHLAPALPPRLGAAAAQGAEEGAASTHGADPNSSASTPPISPEDPGTSDAGVMAPAAFRRRVLRVAPVAFVLLIAASVLTFILHEKTVDLGLRQPRTVAQEAPHPEPWPNVLPAEPPHSAFDPWQQQASGSQADQTFIIPPVLPNTAPQIVDSWGEPSPDENTSKKKVSDREARKQRNKDVTSKNWVQTR
jgi:type II secretory pathway predicted ATPase ExeA